MNPNGLAVQALCDVLFFKSRGCLHHSGVRMGCARIAVLLVSLLHGELRPPLAQLIHVECGVWQVSYLQIPHLQKIS